MKKFITVWVTVFLLIYIFCPYVTLGGTETGTDIIDNNTFIDDVGNLIKIDKECSRIISLFDEHTENLYFLGEEDRLIGVSDTSVFPAEVNSLPKYKPGNNYDAEQIINIKPDVVLVAPEINDRYPAFITKLETNGIFVISLRPETPEDFDIYIRKLAIITGCPEKAEERLEIFHEKLDEVEREAASSNVIPHAFIESSESGYLTPSSVTLPYAGLEKANVTNTAEKKLNRRYKDKDIYFGIDRLKENKDTIDYYFLLRGGGNTAASKDSMYQKSDFRDFKAVEEKHVYEISEKILDSYSFRYITGVREIARMCHPDVFTDVSMYENDEILTRGSFANIVYRYLNVPTYINTNKDYYNYERFNHLYGTFGDVKWYDEDFNIIETIVSRKYLNFGPDENENFCRDEKVTRTDVAEFINILCDVHASDKHTEIRDLPGTKADNVIQRVADNGLMDVQDGYFRPMDNMTNREFIEILRGVAGERSEQS